jgi:hypothetical protein
MSPGTNFARPDEENKMIQDRIKQNENQKKSEIKTPDLDTMTAINKEIAYNESIEKIGPEARTSERIGATALALAKNLNSFVGGKQGAAIKEKTKKELLKAQKDQGKEKLAAVTGEKVDLEKGRTNAMADYEKASAAVDEYKGSREFTERANTVERLTKESEKTHDGLSGALKRTFNDADRKEDKAARKAKIELEKMGGAKDPKLAELTDKKVVAGAAVKQYDTMLENIEEKIKATEEFDSAATSANEIIDEAQERADLINNPAQEASKEEAGGRSASEAAAGGGGASEAAAGGTAAGGGASTIKGSSSSGTGSEPSRNKNLSNFRGETTKPKELRSKASNIGKMDITLGLGLTNEGREYKNAVKTNAVEKADALSDYARGIMEREKENKDSGSYQRAEELVKKYDSLETGEDAVKFVEEQEKRSKEIAKASKGLNSTEEFEKFVDTFDVKK